MSDRIDTVVIGAGVVGLAIARQLALEGREVVVLEKNAQIGAETSSRNSEVIHGGLYYPEGSLKARLCVAGRQRLYSYCEEKGVAYARCGKLIVAVDDDQVGELEALARLARANGVVDAQWLNAAQVTQLEPDIVASAALLSPSTGIVDSHGLMLALQGDLENAGGAVALLSTFEAARADPEGIRLVVSSEGQTTELLATTVINAAGLHAARVAEAFEKTAASAPRLRYAKGSYFDYDGPSPFTHLVYPLPRDGGLGVHATLDLAGRTRFGPDVEWVDEIDYAIDETRARTFYAAIRVYWPGLEDGRLKPAYTGVRPKLHGPGEAAADFYISAPAALGGGRVVHLLGIESPGLTAALAIGQHVAAEL